MNHTAAFQCATCPRNNDPTVGPSCPAWWETVQTHAQTGEVKVWKSCAWEQLPYYLVHFAKGAVSAAAAVESTRNEIVTGFVTIAEALRGTQIAGQVSHDGIDQFEPPSRAADTKRLRE